MDKPKGNTQQDLVYKNTKQRDLMLSFFPPMVKKYDFAPVYFLIPGGGWHMEVRQDMIDFCAVSVDSLRKEGFAVVGIDYRICSEGVVMNDIITDCFDAARYIAKFSDILKIDKHSFVMAGHSAGAHLALMLSYAPQEMFSGEYDDKFSVKAVAAFSPPTILYDKTTHNLGNIVDVFDKADMYREMERTSPINYVTKKSPPTILCAGTDDNLVFANSSEKLYEKLKEYNVDSKIVLSRGGGHCFEQVNENIIPSLSKEDIEKEFVDWLLSRKSELDRRG